ncbi:MFS transporter [uncultured Enterovirga sp.]|uniref:MFS transporter n=1 Tax=uncultured Enterovirga sp. TaxID=2026352 RepID=UPI0035CA1655
MSQAVDPEDGLPVPQRYWSAIAIWLAIAMAVLDSSVANIALPTIAREFRVEAHEAIWIVNAYQLAIVTALLPLASLGEIVGYRRVYLAGLALFTTASLFCALSSTLLELTLARMLQGFGAAGIMSINAALVRFTYPQHLLGRAIGFNALVVSLASAVGPSIAAAILAVAHWPWLFAINAPLGLVTFALAAYALPRTARIARRFDLGGAVLNALAFGFVIGGVDLLTRAGRPLLGCVAIAAGIASGTLLAFKGRAEPSPLLPVDLMRIPVFALSVASSICSFSAQMLAFISLPFLFDGVLHRTPVETGLLMTPWPIMVGILGPIAGGLSDRFPAAILGGIGLVLFAVGLGALAMLTPEASFVDVAWRMALCGCGFGFFQAPNNRTMMLSAPRSRAGAAGGMLATARLTGQTGGATAVAVFFALSPTGGAATSLTVAAGLALLGACLSLGRLLPAAPAA